jgi:hypothetical protein
MLRKYLRMVWIAMLHVAILTAAHNIAEIFADTAHEVTVAVRDELVLDAVLAVRH